MAKDKGQTESAPAAEAPATEASVQLSKKLSTKTICGTLKAPYTTRPIYRVIGVANGIRKGQGTYGEWRAFSGSFEALNLETGEKFAGTSCFLPSVAEDLLSIALSQAQGADANASIQFALEVGIKPLKRRDGTDGYEFTVKPLIPVASNDALSNLRTSITYQP